MVEMFKRERIYSNSCEINKVFKIGRFYNYDIIYFVLNYLINNYLRMFSDTIEHVFVRFIIVYIKQ